MYKNYIFDLYGTLVDISTDEEKEELWEKMSLLYRSYGAQYDHDDLKSKYFKFAKKLMEESGDPTNNEINIENVFFQLFKKKRITPKKKVVRDVTWMFRMLSLEKLELYPYAIHVLSELKAAGKNLYLLSNAQACFTEKELKALGLDDFFDDIYLSSEIGYKKPNVKAFEAIVNEKNLKLEKTIMIGNDYGADIQGAINIGIDSMFIKSNIFNEEAKKVEATFTVENGDLREILNLTLAI
jgi:putative hydrolase of the HAD superfamily